MAAIPLTIPRDPTSAAALARLPEPRAHLSVSIAAHLVAASEAGRVRCPKVRALVDVFARESAA